MNITQKLIAKKIRTSEAHISDIFSGKADVGKKTAKKMAALSGIPWNQIIAMEPDEIKKLLYNAMKTA